jgi:3-oxoacyl-[acyl-carrier-protein] synthase-3
LLISYFLPAREVTNDDLALTYKNPKWSAANIFKKTGIKSRHVVSGELSSDLACLAAEKLFDEFSLDRKSLDFILLCTQSPDYFLPTTACIVQHRLGLTQSTGAFDFNLGCSGYVYGLATTKGLLSAGIAKRLLLITAETYSRHIHPMDKSSRTIFGDAGTATYMDIDALPRLGEFVLGTDGSGASNLIIPAGAMAHRHSNETAMEMIDSGGNVRSQEDLYMNGPEIFSFTLRTVPDLVRQTLDKNRLKDKDIDLYVFHQANQFMLETLRQKLEIETDRFFVDMEDVGNTVSSTIPIALRRAMDKGLIKPGSKVLIAGFGVGYSWGATVLSF